MYAARALGSLVLLFGAGACGLTSSDPTSSGAAGYAGATGTIDFPLGTYDDCATGVHSENGGFLTGSGFAVGSSLELTEDGPIVIAEYTDLNGDVSSFAFEPTTSTAANLAEHAHVGGSSGICVHGIGVSNEEFFPAELSASLGALNYDSGKVFVALHGVMSSDMGSCGQLSTPASFWLACQNGPESTQKLDPSPVQLPAGTYTCNSQLGTHYESNGLQQYVTSGGQNGTLTLTQAGTELTASYQGDSFVTGTLHLNVTTVNTATAAADQSLTTACEVPIDSGSIPPPTAETLPISAAALTIMGSTLILSYTGDMGASSPCPGAQKAGSLVCSKE